MDKTGANFDFSIKTLKDRLGAKVAAIHVPIGAEDSFKGLVDVIEMKAYEYDLQANEEPKEIDVPSNLLDKAKQTRQILIDTVA